MDMQIMGFEFKGSRDSDALVAASSSAKPSKKVLDPLLEQALSVDPARGDRVLFKRPGALMRKPAAAKRPIL